MARRSEFKVLNMRVTPVARQLFAEIAERMGVSQTAAFETLVRKAARDEGLIHVSTRLASSIPVRQIETGESVRLSNYTAPSLDTFRTTLAEIEAIGPIGPSMADEALTSEALYCDHD